MKMTAQIKAVSVHLVCGHCFMVLDGLAALKHAFSEHDKDRDGIIKTSELADVLRSAGMSPTITDLQDITQQVDPYKKGKVNMNSFMKSMGMLVVMRNVEFGVKEAFQVFDSDGSGKISASEMRRLMTNLRQNHSDRDLEHMMREADVNGDGEISYMEFVRMMTK